MGNIYMHEHTHGLWENFKYWAILCILVYYNDNKIKWQWNLIYLNLNQPKHNTFYNEKYFDMSLKNIDFSSKQWYGSLVGDFIGKFWSNKFRNVIDNIIIIHVLSYKF